MFNQGAAGEMPTRAEPAAPSLWVNTRPGRAPKSRLPNRHIGVPLHLELGQSAVRSSNMRTQSDAG
jgi:hypothetical protein